MSKIIRINHIKGANAVPEFNVSKIRAMSDQDAEKRAENDPDAPIITTKMLKDLKVKKSEKL
ncbi:hypothetical protein MNBD_GAMMA18-2108 [hydrothermal vent metagenome]|uniref:Uncharacterized protein n=1 Tax=hydrothermal vent metagenome TaxID=652676 RepID=A0A3B1A297_9ZZZZ